MKVIKYRIALMKTITGIHYLVVYQSVEGYLNIKDNLPDFVKWISEEQEVTILSED